MRNTFFVLLLVSGLGSCDYSVKNKFHWQAENSTIYNDSVTLVSNGVKSFPITQKTSVATIPYLNTLVQQGTEYLYFYNYYSNQVFIYNFTSEILVKAVEYDNQGPNELLPNTTNQVLLTSLDTLIAFDRQAKRISFFRDSVMYDRIDLYQITSRDKLNTYQVWQPSLMECFFMRGDSLFFSLHQYLCYAMLICEGDCNYNSVLTVDIRAKTASARLGVPEIYRYGNWGTQTAQPTHLFHTYNLNQQKFVYSFAADPFLYVEEGEGYGKFFVGSKYFKTIYPQSFSKNKIDKDNSWRHCSTSPFYDRIFYDRYSRLYYRFALHGIALDDYDKGSKSGAFSIIIINEKFKKVGEVYFDKSIAKNYSLKHIVITREGLFILRNDIYSEQPNFISLERFEVKRVSEEKF